MKIGQRMTSQRRNKTWLTWKCRFSAKYRPKLIFFVKKVPNIGASPGFLLKREIVFLTCSVCFRSISWRYFSKWRLKIFSGGNHPPPPVPSDFDGLPYPPCFSSNDLKGFKSDYLDTQGHFILHFGAIGNKPLKSGNNWPPLRKARVKD